MVTKLPGNFNKLYIYLPKKTEKFRKNAKQIENLDKVWKSHTFSESQASRTIYPSNIEGICSGQKKESLKKMFLGLKRRITYNRVSKHINGKYKPINSNNNMIIIK